MSGPRAVERRGPRLLRREVGLGVLLAGTSGAAILVHTFGPLPLSFSVPFVVLPSTCILIAVVLLHRRLYGRLHAFSGRLLLGGAWGLVATLVYDAVRPLLRLAFGFTYDPYRAMPIFGQLMTGLPGSDPMALAAGWTYHFWNGISFGMMLALMRPRGGPVEGFVWAMLLQGLMMAAYPSFLGARLEDPGFLTMGIVGHGLWGIVLGLGLKRTGGRYG